MDIETIPKLEKWMKNVENQHLEFKEAKNSYDFEKLVKYCAALSNEGGGHIILGVSDKIPRTMVGTKAFSDIQRTKNGLIERLHIRIEANEVFHSDKRVLIFTIYGRPVGMPIHYKGAYWMRSGDTLAPMTPDMLKRIFAESQPDFSAEVRSDANLHDLESKAIEKFRNMWIRRSGNIRLKSLKPDRLLKDAELIMDKGITNAALILLGKHKSLGRFLPQSEIIFEYRSKDISIPYQQREEYRNAFFLILDDLWETINMRNELYSYHVGLFPREILTFNKTVIREAILNAVSHRDYRLPSSVFIRQFPQKIEIISPGGFPPGITPDNIIWKQYPRNRRIAEVFAKCGLVERSGQGVDRMFEQSVKEGKSLPSYDGTDNFQVSLILNGEIRDPRFLNFWEKIGQKTLADFSTKDLILLDYLHREVKIPDILKSRIQVLIDQGVIERISRSKYILSKKYYDFIDKRGAYTRKRGLDRETNKYLILKHIKENKKRGSPFREFSQALPSVHRGYIQGILNELKREGKVIMKGKTKGARWYPAE